MPTAEERRNMKSHQWIDGAGQIQSERWVVIEVKETEDRSSPIVECRAGYYGNRQAAEDSVQQIADDWGRERRLGIARVYLPDIEVHQATVTWHPEDEPEEGAE